MRPALPVARGVTIVKAYQWIWLLAGSLSGAAVRAADAPAAGAAAPNAEYATSWDEYQAYLKQAHGGTRLTRTSAPDWSGVWQRDAHGLYSSFDDTAGSNPKLSNPIYGRNTASLTPPYEDAYEKKIDEISKGHEWDRISYCLPAGFPRWLTEPFMREFIVTPSETWMTHEQVNETRRIYTDGRGHVADDDAVPLWMGDSIGFWDHDTLVVHTNHMKAGEYQRGEPDFSYQISTVERIRKSDPNTVIDHITVYDPLSLTKPWHATFTYRKVKDQNVRINYDSCEENNNVYLAPDGSTQYILPGNPRYHDPETFGIPPVAVGSDRLPAPEQSK